MTNVDMKAREIIEDLPTAIVRWYPFRHGGKLLFLGDDVKLANMLRRVYGMNVVVAGIEQTKDISGIFDYVICIGWLERISNPVEILQGLHAKLADDGTLLLGVNNRLGIRLFCGERDLYTSRVFDGIDNYHQSNVRQGRMYACNELKNMLIESGWKKHKFYSVLHSLEEPVMLFAEGQLPKESLTNRIIPSYQYPHSVFIEEELLYDTLVANSLLYPMANAYLIECPMDGNFADALYVTSSLERGRENAMMTVIHSDGTVSKEAAYPEGKKRLARLDENIRAMKKAGVSVVEGHFDNGCYVMPYIEVPTGQVYLRELLLRDKDKFLEAMDAFSRAIRSSSPIHRGEFIDANSVRGETELLEQAFLDMVPLNSFFIDGKFVFFDQEFSEANYPVNVLLTRMIATFYAGSPELEQILPADVLYERYGLLEEKQRWLEMEWAFLRELRQETPLADYHRRVRRNEDVLAANRRRMNYPVRDYRKLFFDIFEHADTKKLIIFGSGRFAREFMDLYRVRYPVYAIVDNNENAWGQEIHGVTVQSPALLKDFQPGECKVLICIKQFQSVMEQLEDMWVEDYSVFDPGKSYAIPKVPLQEGRNPVSEGSKPYRVGYVAGVFDLFHIGHLNILRRAKEHCDYLIVGVVSDRQVREYKKVEPFVPFKERLDMIRSCRYVDEAHEIPFEHPDTDMAWKLYRFDVQFSGSDYEHDPVWLKKKEWLEERGSTMVFFPYTQSTSSTRLKKLIEERLI